MALRIGKVDVWVGEVPDRPGGLSRILAPIAQAGGNVECAIARRQPDKPGMGIAFIYPIKGPKAEAAARGAGLSPAQQLATLRVEGDDRPGLGHDITDAVARTGVNMRGLSAAVLGGRCVIFLGFDSNDDASRAMQAIQSSNAAKSPPRPAAKKKARPKKSAKKSKKKAKPKKRR